MSPEHFTLGADERSDVWSLGIVLYEMLTLRRPFAGQTMDECRKLVEVNQPVAPAQQVPNVPGTLAAIFEKATRTRPEDRYATAAELALDLRRWLAFEPTTARRVWPPERFSLWARRSPGRAIASITAGLMASAAALAVIWALSARANVQTTRATAAVERAKLAEDGDRAKQREILMRDLVQLRLSTHADGWTTEADKLIAQIAPLGVDDDLRTQAASCLMGMDANWVAGFTDAPAQSVAISPDARWVLSGGPRADIPVRLLDVEINRSMASQLQEKSLVMFLADGTPVQIALPAGGAGQLPILGCAAAAFARGVENAGGLDNRRTDSALSPGGSRLAIAGRRG